MKLIRYQEVKEFLRDTQNYLVNRESVNNIILGTCLMLIQKPNNNDRQPYFAVVKDEKSLLLTAMITPPFPIAIYSEKLDCRKELELLVENIVKEQLEISGVVAISEISKLFATIWSEKTGCALVEGMDMRLYDLVKINNIRISKGKFKIAEEGDFELISKWIIDMEKDAGSSISIERAKEIAQDKIRNKQLYIWEDGLPVSMACSTRPTVNGIFVNMVYTPKEYRKNGYASSCVAVLSQYLLDKGYKFCSLITDLSNPTSNGIYIKIGYKPICNFKGYNLSDNHKIV